MNTSRIAAVCQPTADEDGENAILAAASEPPVDEDGENAILICG